MVHKLFTSVLVGLHQPTFLSGFGSPARSLLAFGLQPTAGAPAQALDTGEVLGGPAAPCVHLLLKLAHSPLPAKMCAEARIVHALQWADPPGQGVMVLY